MHSEFPSRTRTRRLPAQVANQLASMFIDENLKVREQQSYGTADFLSSELEKTKKALDEKEQTLSDIKRRNIADLPESKQFHLQASGVFCAVSCRPVRTECSVRNRTRCISNRC